MFNLQFFERPFDVPDLVRFGHLAVALQVDKGLSRPRRLEDMMTAADSGFAKKTPAEIQQVLEAHILRALKENLLSKALIQLCWVRVIKQASVHGLIIAYTLSLFNIILFFANKPLLIKALVPGLSLLH
jgi:hypothetical protein